MRRKVRACAHCRLEYWRPDRKNEKYCSNECFRAAIHVERTADEQRAMQRDRVYAYAHPDLEPGHGRPIVCGMCGQSFETRKQGDAKYCTKRCAQRAARLAQKRVGNGTAISWRKRERVWQRDEGICQLCGVVVDRALSVFDPRALAIDHVIPKVVWLTLIGSRRGVHGDANLQVTHRVCNARKHKRIEATHERLNVAFDYAQSVLGQADTLAGLAGSVPMVSSPVAGPQYVRPPRKSQGFA